MLVYAGFQKEKYNIEKYNKERNPSPERKRRNALIGKIYGCIMMLATCVYLFLGFTSGSWEAAPEVYSIAAIFCGITVVVLEGEGKQGNRRQAAPQRRGDREDEKAGA